MHALHRMPSSWCCSGCRPCTVECCSGWPYRMHALLRTPLKIVLCCGACSHYHYVTALWRLSKCEAKLSVMLETSQTQPCSYSHAQTSPSQHTMVANLNSNTESQSITDTAKPLRAAVCCVWAGLPDCPHALSDRLASVAAAQFEAAAHG